MRKVAIGCLALMLLVAGSAVGQTAYHCDGPVTGVSFDKSGVVSFSGIGGINAGLLCQLGNTANGYSPDACRAAYAQLLLAEMTGQSMRIYFNDNLSCTTQPSWSWLTTIYYGPGTI